MGAADAVNPLQLVSSAPDPAVDRVRLALASLDPSPVPAERVAEAEAVLAELAAMAGTTESAREERKLLLWSAVAAARTRLKELEQGSTPTADRPAPSPAAIAAVERAWSAVDAAQAKAERRLAAPSAFRKLVEAKREAQHVLESHGFASIDDYRAVIEGTAAPATLTGADVADVLAAAEAEVARAEAEWEAFLAPGPAGGLVGGLPATTEADALRARAYRILGQVVDDAALATELRALVDRARADQAARELLRASLAAVGVDPGADPVAVATAWLSSRTS